MIYAYGCSITYGEHILGARDAPSPHAWCSQIDPRVTNLAEPGSSADRVAHKILHSTFEPGDRVMIMWPPHDRWTVYTHERPIDYYPSSEGRLQQLYYKYLHTPEQAAWNTLRSVSLVYYYLKHLDIPLYQCHVNPTTVTNQQDYAHMDFDWDTDINTLMHAMGDYAQDGCHPGARVNRRIALQLCSKPEFKQFINHK